VDSRYPAVIHIFSFGVNFLPAGLRLLWRHFLLKCAQALDRFSFLPQKIFSRGPASILREGLPEPDSVFARQIFPSSSAEFLSSPAASPGSCTSQREVRLPSLIFHRQHFALGFVCRRWDSFLCHSNIFCVLQGPSLAAG
jgi:hypothetical protein